MAFSHRQTFADAQVNSQLWPSHKALCGADPDYFHVAPLSKRECRDLETVLDGPIYQCGEELFEQIPITLRQAMTLQYFQGFEDIEEDLSTWAVSSDRFATSRRDPVGAELIVAHTGRQATAAEPGADHYHSCAV